MDLVELGKLATAAETKIVLLVMDGLGGLPEAGGEQTELEAARTPNLDRLAAEGICGLQQPVGYGITPGSGPGHLGLFGYDPLRHEVGRGALSAVGVGFDFRRGDVAARGNFCTIDAEGLVTDRRAGRIATEINQRLCEKLRQIDLPGVELFVETEKEHRFLLVLRGEGLSEDVSDTDPQQTGREPLPARAQTEAAQSTAELVNSFVEQAREVLRGDEPANMLLLRGFAMRPDWPQLPELFGLRPAAIAEYPMYRGVAKLIGMETLEAGQGFPAAVDCLVKNWDAHDYFYVHAKKVDSAGEDGDFQHKVRRIEEVDEQVPRILELKPDVIVVTGDHSTPSRLASHSWHPVPVLLWADTCRPDSVRRFGDRDCVTGGLGPRLPATELLPLALAHALRLAKFGA
jgi:2,3-bisphosphoglycerate-independent phosphoglycerate mutase